MTTPQSPSPFVVRGRVVTPTGVLDDGAVVVDGSTIAWVGPAAELPAHWRAHDLPATGPDGPAGAPAAGPSPAFAPAAKPAAAPPPDPIAEPASAPSPDPAAAPATGPSPEPATGPSPDPGGAVVLPGLVDLHDHGGGGASFPDAASAAEARTAIAEHLRHGTTSLVASLVTAPRDELLARTALLADLAEAGDLAGIHLEGPFLSHARCGAQNPGDMLAGDPALVRAIAAAARGHLVTMTIAPEVPGVVGDDDVVAALVAAGAIPSIGHTDASAEQVDAAVARGFDLLATDPHARSGRLTATHLFNGMRPLHHRDPGPIAACLAAAARGELVVELVADGTHLDDGTVRAVFDLVGADAIALVTDAMAAAGMPDGDYQLGPKAVTVAEGVARLSGPDGAIAGGTAHLLDVLRRVVGAGVPLADAVRAAATTPASVLGRHDVGALVAGRRADLVVTDPSLRPRGVLRGGAWVAGVGA